MPKFWIDKLNILIFELIREKDIHGNPYKIKAIIVSKIVKIIGIINAIETNLLKKIIIRKIELKIIESNIINIAEIKNKFDV